MLFVLLFVGLVSAAVASPSAEPLQTSARISLPQTIQDSLPWFAVFELQNESTPFTLNHLNELAKKSERVALVYFATWCIPCREGLKQISENGMSKIKENHLWSHRAKHLLNLFNNINE